MNAEINGRYAMEYEGNVCQIVNLQTGKIEAKMEGPGAREIANAMMVALNQKSQRPWGNE